MTENAQTGKGRAILMAAILATSSSAAYGVEIDGPARESLRIITFANTPTAAAMRVHDYPKVIWLARSALADFGYRDLVNLCAAYAFEGRYAEAERACGRAVIYSDASRSRWRSAIEHERWIAYANRGVVRALERNVSGAHSDFAQALDLGGERRVITDNQFSMKAAEGSGIAIVSAPSL